MTLMERKTCSGKMLSFVWKNVSSNVHRMSKKFIGDAFFINFSDFIWHDKQFSGWESDTYLGWPSCSWKGVFHNLKFIGKAMAITLLRLFSKFENNFLFTKTYNIKSHCSSAVFPNAAVSFAQLLSMSFDILYETDLKSMYRG